MSKHDTCLTRRSVLKGLAAVPVVAAVGLSTSAHAAAVDPNSAQAQALKYTDNSSTDGQSCANCQLYQGGDAASGGCPLFAGSEVAAAGWCSSWVARS